MTDSVTNTTSRGIVPALLAIVTLASIGCQSGYRSDARAVTRQWDSGNYTAAAMTGTAAAKAHQSDDIDRVVYNLEAGRTAQAAGDVRTSIEYYDLAYEDVRPYLDTEAEATVSEAVVTTAVNQSMIDHITPRSEHCSLFILYPDYLTRWHCTRGSHLPEDIVGMAQHITFIFKVYALWREGQPIP